MQLLIEIIVHLTRFVFCRFIRKLRTTFFLLNRIDFIVNSLYLRTQWMMLEMCIMQKFFRKKNWFNAALIPFFPIWPSLDWLFLGQFTFFLSFFLLGKQNLKHRKREKVTLIENTNILKECISNMPIIHSVSKRIVHIIRTLKRIGHT